MDPPSRFGDAMAAYPILFYGLHGIKLKRFKFLRMDKFFFISLGKEGKNMFVLWKKALIRPGIPIFSGHR